MSPAEEKIWRALDPEDGATLLEGRPVHAFWPLLAPSFRWVLLAPHRRAGGAEIVWEWRANRSASRPSDEDLADLRLRLRDGLDLFEEDLRRHPALPGGISIGELHRGIERMLDDLRHGSDSTLAAHAVLTTQGWMIRSWGFDTPAPARAEGAENAPAPATRSHSQAPPPCAPTTSEPPRRFPFRRTWRLPFAIGLMLAGLGLALLRERSQKTDTHSENTPSPPSPTQAAPPSSADTTTSANSASNASESGKFSTPLRSAEKKKPASPLPAHAPEIAGTPLAISGRMSPSPGVRVAQAGPPSKLPGKDEVTPTFAAPRGDSQTDAPPAPGGAPDSASPKPSQPVAPNEENIAPASRGTPPTPPPQAAEIRESDITRTPPVAPMPAPFSVEAREAAEPAPPPPSLPGAPADARKAPPIGDGASETILPDAPAENHAAKTAPVPEAEPAAALVASTSASAASEAGSSPNSSSAPDGDLRIVFLGHAMPWRIMLERDAPLPTRPTEGNAEAEMRAARIAAWAEARARMPLAFRPREGRAGWELRLAPEATAARPLRWLVGRTAGGIVSEGAAATAGDDAAWISWQETDRRDLDAFLLAADGKALARVRRLVAENRIEVRAAPAIAELRPWFSLRLKPGVTPEGMSAPAGWSLSTEAGELVSRGPAGALRIRWLHSPSGWCAHGGYARENP